MIGKRIVEQRKKLKLTQEKLAEKIGISRSRLSQYELDLRQPDNELLVKMSDFFGVSTDYLLKGEKSGQLMIDLENLDGFVESKEHVRFPLRLKKAIEESGIAISDIAQEFGKNEKDFIKDFLTSPASGLPDDETLERLSQIVGQSTEYLLGRNNNKNEYNSILQINRLLNKYGINQSGFFDIEKWKKAGPEGIKQLESYFQFIVDQAERIEKEEQQED